MSTWVAVLTSSAVAFVLKLLGYVVPQRALAHPRGRRSIEMLPAALLASLIVLQTFTTGSMLVLDARAAGLIAAVIALLFRAPFIAVVVIAAATAAALRLLGWQ